MEQTKEKKVKTPIQESIKELRAFLPKGLAVEIATSQNVTEEYVRLVWQGVRESIEITDATLNEIKAAKKNKEAFKNKLSAVIS